MVAETEGKIYRATDLSKGKILTADDGTTVLIMDCIKEDCIQAIQEGTGYGVLKRVREDGDEWRFETCFSNHMQLNSYY